MPLLKLYVTPLDGLVTVIVPVAVAQVGCVVESVGTEGTFKGALMVADAAVEVQLDVLSLTITA